MSHTTFVKSTLILSVATLLSKLLGSIFRIPLQNIAGDEVLGIFSLVYPVYMVALTLSVAGIPLAISKLIAEARAKDRSASIKHIYITASILALSFGILSFSFMWGFSDWIASGLGGADTHLALIVVSATLLVSPYMAVYRGYFQGFEDMRPTATSQVLEQFIRVGFILVIAYLFVKIGYANDVVAGGVMIGSIAGALVSLVYLRFRFGRFSARVGKSTGYSFAYFSRWSRAILKVAIPIAIGAITMPLLNMVDSFTISYGLRIAGAASTEVSYLYGIYGRGLSVVQIATVFATSIVLPLIPLITKKLTANDVTGTRATIEQTHQMTHLVSWPTAVGLVVLTLPVNLALFTNLEGSSMLAIIGASSVFTSLTILGTGILQGMNRAMLAAWIIISGVVVKIFANIYLIQLFGLDGAALATLLVYLLLFIVNSIVIFRTMRFKVFNLSIVKMVLASVLMGGVISTPMLFMNVGEWTRIGAFAYLITAILVGAVVYFVLIWMMNAVDRSLIRGLPVVGKYFR